MDFGLEKKFPVSAKEYKLYEEVGEGVSATVYRALCIPLNEVVAIKVLDLEKCNNDLDGIRREVQTMSLIDNPNVLRAHCSFMTGHNLWVIMPYMAGGSCLHIIKSSYPEGFEEPVIATLLREALKALVYLHSHGHIHRDVKAGNILINSNGSVKLADFGVSACMFDTGDRQRSRNTFVGTPCWMAPEVMQQLHGYDFKADIWSFGITALELAHGHAPFSKYPPMKVLLMTLQNAPPGLDYERDKRFSKSFKELVAACLVKDPKKRPSSEKLLKHHFFKHGRVNEYLTRTILSGIAPLGERFRILKMKEAELLLQNKALYGDKEHLSQQEYIRGISAWNFNLDDLKHEATLIQDNDTVISEESSGNGSRRDINDHIFSTSDMVSHKMANCLNVCPIQEDALNDIHNSDSSLLMFPTQPLQALKGYFDIGEDDSNDCNQGNMRFLTSNEESRTVAESSVRTFEQEHDRNNEILVQKTTLPRFGSSRGNKKFFSGSQIQDNTLSPKKCSNNGDRENQQQKFPHDRNYSGPLLSFRGREPQNIPPVDDKSEVSLIQRKGRFEVMSEELSPMVRNTSCIPTLPKILGGSSLIPSLQVILEQNNVQREEILRLINFVNKVQIKPPDQDGSIPSQAYQSSREQELELQVTYLHKSVNSLAGELQKVKIINSELELQLSACINKGEENKN